MKISMFIIYEKKREKKIIYIYIYIYIYIQYIIFINYCEMNVSRITFAAELSTNLVYIYIYIYIS